MGFRKAKAEQAALKMGIYGPAGSGKTFTALLVAEGLAKRAGKRVAFVDTERGADFYVQHVEGRAHHPEAFDIDALYTRSLVEVLEAVRSLKPTEHNVIVLDSITHLWEAAIAAYRGKKTSAGTIPMHAWGSIKKPYKDLMHFLLNAPMHVLILGRQGNQYGDDAETGEMVQLGYKMKAEGETAYEPHILIRMSAVLPKHGKTVDKNAVAVPVAFVEKDRTGLLAGRFIEWPGFDSLAAPLLGLLGDKQAVMQSGDEAAVADGDALAKQEAYRFAESNRLRREWEARIALCKTPKEVDEIGKQITPAVKKLMTSEDVESVRQVFLAAKSSTTGPPHLQLNEDKMSEWDRADEREAVR